MFRENEKVVRQKRELFLLRYLSEVPRCKYEFIHFIMEEEQQNSISIWLHWLHYKLILEMYRLLQIEQCIIYSAGNMTNGFQRSIAHELRNFARSEYLRYTWIREEGPEWKTWHKEDEGGWQERKETLEGKEEERHRNCVIIDLCAATPAFSIKLFAVPATNTKIYGQISV